VTIAIAAVLVAAVVVAAWWWWRRADRPVEPAAQSLGVRLGSMFGRSLEPAFWEELEERLIAADTGAAVAHRVVEAVRERRPTTTDEARMAVRAGLLAELGDRPRSLDLEGAPSIVVVVGVNGSGKTTTVAKLAAKVDGPAVVAAADTYRAAAVTQLQRWGERLGFDVVAGSEGADPAAVAFDGLGAARSRGAMALIVDTAGRLHSNTNLMDELGKIVRVLLREAGSIDEVLLVIDGSAGQNAIAQAAAFTEAVGVTGVVVTKLDGSARGGAVLAIEQDLDVPIKLIGVGEGSEDLLHFSPEGFVDDMLRDR